MRCSCGQRPCIQTKPDGATLHYVLDVHTYNGEGHHSLYIVMIVSNAVMKNVRSSGPELIRHHEGVWMDAKVLTASGSS